MAGEFSLRRNMAPHYSPANVVVPPRDRFWMWGKSDRGSLHPAREKHVNLLRGTKYSVISLFTDVHLYFQRSYYDQMQVQKDVTLV